MSDTSGGFASSIILTSPTGARATVTGFKADVSQSIDPETGQLVSGRVASAAIPLTAIDEAGIGEPVGIADRATQPWVVEMQDVRGRTWKFKVTSTLPDRLLGVLVCQLTLLV